MPSPKPPPDSVLARAAELRAAGNSWESVAAQMRRSVHTIRKWPALYPDRWKAALRNAERRALAEAGAESVLVLRQLLRSDDDKVRRDSAKFLVYLRLEQAKLDQKAEATAPPEPPSEARRIAAFLEAHTDEQLAQLVAHMRNAPTPRLGSPLADDGPGPD